MKNSSAVIRNNNKGMSLIEMIVVVAILAILILVSASLFQTIFGWSLNKCVNTVEKALGKTKVEVLSKDGTAQMKIEKRSDGYYYVDVTGYSTEKFSDKKVVVYYTTANEDGSGTKTVELKKGDPPIVISFDRSTAAFKPTETGADTYYTSILLNRQKRDKTLVLVPKTGHMFIEEGNKT